LYTVFTSNIKSPPSQVNFDIHSKDDDDSVSIYLDFFEEQEDGSYCRFSEDFTERIYIAERIVCEDHSVLVHSIYIKYKKSTIAGKF